VIRLKAEEDHRMVGFVAADVRPNENVAWISTICVLPEFRQRGAARMLLNACENQARMPRIKLCVRAENKPAINLYESSGYRGVDVWKRYYNDGEDALVMQKDR
jgi:ribosomal-protein-alanine N-acetyltransferase